MVQGRVYNSDMETTPLKQDVSELLGVLQKLGSRPEFTAPMAIGIELAMGTLTPQQDKAFEVVRLAYGLRELKDSQMAHKAEQAARAEIAA